MQQVAMDLDNNFSIRFTLYANDNTIWTENDDFPTIERACEALRNTLLTIERSLATTGVKASQERTHYFLIGGQPMKA